MAEFQFRLAPVLRFRERGKEEKQWELGLLFDARAQKAQEIAEIEQEQLRAESIDTAVDGAILTAVTLARQAAYIDTLGRRAQLKRGELGPIDSAIASKREELVEALRSVKSLEQAAPTLGGEIPPRAKCPGAKTGRRGRPAKIYPPWRRAELALRRQFLPSGRII